MKKFLFSINLIECFFCLFLFSFFSFYSDAYSAPSAYYDIVQKIYIGYYQRPADPAGLIWWARELDRKGGDLNTIIDAFASSPESQALYGPITSANISTVVNDIYVALLARNAESAGRDWYVAEFNAGRFTSATIMLNVLNGTSTNPDLQSINNKLAAANLFTSAIDPELDGLNFQATYAADDVIAARNFLSLVTADTATAQTQAGTTSYIQTNIADPNDPIYSSGFQYPFKISNWNVEHGNNRWGNNGCSISSDPALTTAGGYVYYTGFAAYTGSPLRNPTPGTFNTIIEVIPYYSGLGRNLGSYEFVGLTYFQIDDTPAYWFRNSDLYSMQDLAQVTSNDFLTTIATGRTLHYQYATNLVYYPTIQGDISLVGFDVAKKAFEYCIQHFPN